MRLYECTTCLSKFYKKDFVIVHVIWKQHKGFRTYKDKRLPK